jgi:hypothetical protein
MFGSQAMLQQCLVYERRTQILSRLFIHPLSRIVRTQIVLGGPVVFRAEHAISTMSSLTTNSTAKDMVVRD